MSTSQPLRAVIYARLSNEDTSSTSIASQVEACKRYAAQQGWEVVGVFSDDGVSATSKRPEERPGLTKLFDSSTKFDRLLTLTHDRMSRNTADTLLIDMMVKDAGARVVTTDNTWNTDTDEGEFMTVLHSAINRLEASKTSTRIRRNFAYMRKVGRATHGAPYGYRTIPNPDTAVGGRVFDRDPERIEWVREMVKRVNRGWTIYGITQWLNEVGATLPRRDGRNKHITNPEWHYNVVERILRNPMLAGLTANNPGNSSKTRGPKYLLDENQEYLINERTAIMTVAERNAMLAKLDNRGTPQSLPRSERATTSPLLSGLVYCAHCERRIHRGTSEGRDVYRCPNKGCHQTISHLTRYVVDRYLERTGGLHDFDRYITVEDSLADDDRLVALEERLKEVGQALGVVDDEAEEERLWAELKRLRSTREELRSRPTPTRRVEVIRDPDWPESYADARDDHDRRVFLEWEIERVVISRGMRGGRGIDTTRIDIQWRHPDPSPEELADLALAAEQIGTEQAAERPEG